MNKIGKKNDVVFLFIPKNVKTKRRRDKDIETYRYWFILARWSGMSSSRRTRIWRAILLYGISTQWSLLIYN